MSPRRAVKRRIGCLLVVAGCLVTLAGVLYLAAIQYVIWRESVSPSTERVLILRNGERIPLRQPTQRSVVQNQTRRLAPATQTPTRPRNADQKPGSAAYSPLDAEPGDPQQILPPIRAVLPTIKADWPVVLSDGKALPRFKGVGWLMGSAFPGGQGNLVLFGHLDGGYATFGSLAELKVGDVFSVYTRDGEYRYRVRKTFNTTPDDVMVMAPTDTPTATLITCSGNWNTMLKSYDLRLVVTADLVGKAANPNTIIISAPQPR